MVAGKGIIVKVVEHLFREVGPDQSPGGDVVVDLERFATSGLFDQLLPGTPYLRSGSNHVHLAFFQGTLQSFLADYGPMLPE